MDRRRCRGAPPPPQCHSARSVCCCVFEALICRVWARAVRVCVCCGMCTDYTFPTLAMPDRSAAADAAAAPAAAGAGAGADRLVRRKLADALGLGRSLYAASPAVLKVCALPPLQAAATRRGRDRATASLTRPSHTRVLTPNSCVRSGAYGCGAGGFGQFGVAVGTGGQQSGKPTHCTTPSALPHSPHPSASAAPQNPLAQGLVDRLDDGVDTVTAKLVSANTTAQVRHATACHCSSCRTRARDAALTLM